MVLVILDDGSYPADRTHIALF